MRTALIAIALFALAPFAGAQLPDEEVRRSSSPRGVQIRGDVSVNASARNLNAVAVGSENTATNTAGAVKGNTQIQGTTRINATMQNSQSVAVGKGNQVDNTVGSIGGNR